MNRAESIAVISKELGDAVAIHANGMICRESAAYADRERNFYMLGSMGLAACIGLGFAMERPDVQTVVVDGDGNLLMFLEGLAMVGAMRPENLLHIVLDNQCYQSTGGQRSISMAVSLDKVALACGYRETRRVSTAESLRSAIQFLLDAGGPSLIVADVSAESGPPAPRIGLSPEAVANRIRLGLYTAVK